MKYNPNIYHRQTIRLKGYDYSQAGLYFITICCQDKACLFGKISDEEMILNDAGKMIKSQWFALTDRFKNIELHEFAVMPNHFHGILQITTAVGAPLVGAQLDNVGAQLNNVAGLDDGDNAGRPQGHAPTGKTLGDMVDAFKSVTTLEYIRGVKNCKWETFNGKMWQRNYYEHIIRNEQSHQNISDYIINNTAKWKDDKFYSP